MNIPDVERVYRRQSTHGKVKTVYEVPENWIQIRRCVRGVWESIVLSPESRVPSPELCPCIPPTPSQPARNTNGMAVGILEPPSSYAAQNKFESTPFIYQHTCYSAIPIQDILHCGAGGSTRRLGYPAGALRSEIAHMVALTLTSLVHRYQASSSTPNLSNDLGAAFLQGTVSGRW